jgi:hypothetical protein
MVMIGPFAQSRIPPLRTKNPDIANFINVITNFFFLFAVSGLSESGKMMATLFGCDKNINLKFF